MRGATNVCQAFTTTWRSAVGKRNVTTATDLAPEHQATRPFQKVSSERTLEGRSTWCLWFGSYLLYVPESQEQWWSQICFAGTGWFCCWAFWQLCFLVVTCFRRFSSLSFQSNGDWYRMKPPRLSHMSASGKPPAPSLLSRNILYIYINTYRQFFSVPPAPFKLIRMSGF